MGSGICGIGRWLLRLWPVGPLLDMMCRVFIVCLDLGSEANDKYCTRSFPASSWCVVLRAGKCGGG